MPDGPVLLDTHVWIWTVEGDRRRLNARAVSAIERASRRGEVLVAAISVWEIAMVEAKGRIALSMPVDEWVAAALRAPGVRLLDLTPAISVDSARLPGRPVGDAADRILVASARSAGARLATCDAAMIAYAAGGHVAALDARP
jgi:PIN domain nuclease of toxin-antitoxin system